MNNRGAVILVIILGLLSIAGVCTDIVETNAKGVTRISIKGVHSEKQFVHHFLLDDPPRFVIDVMEPRCKPKINRMELYGTFKQVRIGTYYTDKVRFVFDFKEGFIQEPNINVTKDSITIQVKAPEVTEGKYVTLSPSSRTSANIRATVVSYLGGIRYLYNKQLRYTPNLQGKLSIKFEIDQKGNVTSVHEVSSSLNCPELVGKIINTMLKWKFDAVKEAGNTDVTYPFVFNRSL